MTQLFSKEQHTKFINKFNIKKNPTKVEINFYNKTEKYLKYIKWIPWLKMVWIWNSISMNCADENSDIDLYIVTDEKRIWFVRILVTIIFQILWVRKNEKNHAWRFCLSFFSTIKWMDFNTFKIENDIYLYFWIIYFKPILDYENTYDNFITKNNSWLNIKWYEDIIKENKKFIKYTRDNKCIIKKCSILKIFWIIYYSFLNFIEYILKSLFSFKTINTYKKIWKPYWVIINNNLLKFHNWDIREEIKKELIN